MAIGPGAKRKQRTIFLECPRDENLSKEQRAFRNKVLEGLEARGASILPGLSATASLEDRFQAVRRCHGVLVLGFTQWEARRLARNKTKSIALPSEFTHLGCALAVAARRPLLVFREKALAARGALRQGAVRYVVDLPSSLDPTWLAGPRFDATLGDWLREVEDHHDVFLGYSTQSAPVANLLFKYLTGVLGIRVLDWHQFEVSKSLQDSIHDAERRTQCGIFLFLADDAVRAGAKRVWAPRDNVVYEAGVFTGAKGPAGSLVIIEEGVKLPTDLGGIKHVVLQDRDRIGSLETPIRAYLETRLLDPDTYPEPIRARVPTAPGGPIPT